MAEKIGKCPTCGGWLSDDPKLAGLTCMCPKPELEKRKNGTKKQYAMIVLYA